MYIGELQAFTVPIESIIGPMSGGGKFGGKEANESGAYLQGNINVVQGDSGSFPVIAIAQLKNDQRR